MASRKSRLDSIIEQLDKARAEKTPFGVPIPETQEIQEGLNILNAPTQEQRHEILRRCLPPALMQWAMTKMGNDSGQYIEDGLRYFINLILVRRAIEDKCDPLKVLQETPFVIPLKLRRSPLFPFNPVDALNEYGDVVARAKDIQRKTQRSIANRKFTFIDQLPTSSQKAEQYCSMKASHIALDHLARKYKLPIGPEALKKHLRLARNPKMMMDRIIKDFERRTGHPQKFVKSSRNA